MFTNFLAYIFYTIIGSDLATKHAFLMKAHWVFNGQAAMTEMFVGGMMCSLAVAVVVMIGRKIDKAYKVA